MRARSPHEPHRVLKVQRVDCLAERVANVDAVPEIDLCGVADAGFDHMPHLQQRTRSSGIEIGKFLTLFVNCFHVIVEVKIVSGHNG